jgi:hypothetical protein
MVVAVLGIAAAATAAWDPNTDSSLVAWWALDDGSGTAAKDSSGNGNNGVVNGGAKWVVGRIDGALQFNGSDARVVVPHIPFDNRSFTITMWVNPVLYTGEQVVFSTGLTGADNTDMHLRLGGAGSGNVPPGGVRIGFYNNDLDTVGGLIQDNKWYHLTFWYDYEHKDRKIFVNGVQKAEATANPFLGTTGDVVIGAWGTGQWFRGIIDDVRIYKRALTAAEIKSLVPPVLKAVSPSPADGATGVTTPVLQWTPGETAVFVDIYVGTTPDLSAANRVKQLTATSKSWYQTVPPLEPGQKYYWRVDALDAKKKLIVAGDVWSFTMATVTAYSPTPRNGDKWIDPNSDLAWQPGADAQSHDVYFGTDKDLVANRDPSVQTGKDLLVASVELPTLQPGTTYYWLVDEYDSLDEKHEGELWSFTTNDPRSLGGVKAEYFRNMTVSGAPFLTQIEPDIDHNWGDPGGPAAGVVDNFSARWTADLEIAIADTYTFIANTDDGVRVWLNDNLIIDDWVDKGASDISSEGIALQAGIYSLRMEYYENTGGASAQLYWQTPTLVREIIPPGPLQPPVRAKAIYPKDNDVNVPQDLTLMWSVGEKAVTHDVYFGTDKAAVAAATPADAGLYKGSQAKDENTFVPGALDWNKTYYWRIDEVNSASADSPWKGAVWSFTTADFIVVDDFESYTDADVGRIFQTWIDGWGYTTPAPGNPGNGTGSTVGYVDPPFAEHAIVHGGGSSMPLAYNNADSPYYSEAERTFDSPQNWTINGVTTLSLAVHGYPEVNNVSVAETGGKMNLTGSGADIWGNSDELTYAFKTLNGDGTLVARVASFGTGTQTWAKGGVMVRQSVDGGSMQASMDATGGAANGASFQYRATTGGASGNTDSTIVIAPPCWVKIERLGDTFSGYISTDGSSWSIIGSQDVVMTGPVCIGLCVCSHQTGEQRTFQFDSIKTTGSVTGQWQGAAISSPRYNNPQNLYVAVQDSAGKLAVVTDATAVNSATWVVVKMPLSSFTGVSMTKVKKIFVGVGDRKSPAADGTGMLFIDDIRIVK